jgi:hypothetical protein
MSTRSTPLFQTILARLSFGAVPVDGAHWFDPRDAVKSREQAGARDKTIKVPDADWSPVGISPSRRHS